MEVETTPRMRSLISEAKRRKLWLHHTSREVWISPGELEAANAKGEMLWGHLYWEVRDPMVLARLISAQIESRKEDLKNLMIRIAQSKAEKQ
jgi:hypothetical protein